MKSPYVLIDIIFNLYLMIVILRIWLQLARADFYNPFSQFVIKATHPIVGPLRRVLPSFGSVDSASLVLALIVAATKIILIGLLGGGTSINPLSVLISSVFVVLIESMSLIFYILIIRAIMSWISQGYNPFEALLQQLTEPLLAPIRRVIPPIGGLDLSILVAIVALQFLPILVGDIFGIFMR
ncbi:YggT family protein [Alteromonadaceae bacterium BrNp21-10]|nr:YggT family protein [Alteromonadaceae bacterium BrNp21-10]